MKKIILFLIVILSVNTGLKCQNAIAVTSPNGSTTLHNTLEAAYTSASDGDYIYLPGGNYTITSAIRKKINLIGAGHYPDSTVYTNRTIIDGSISIGKGSSNSLIEGLYVMGNINFAPNEKTSDVIIRRCNVSAITIGTVWSRIDTSRVFNPQIIDNVIRTSITCHESHGFLVKGNIIGNSLSNCIYYGGLAQNNIFLNTTLNGTLGDLRNVSFKNNIFMNDKSIGSGAYGCYGNDGTCGNFNCTFINNLFVAKDTTTNIFSIAIVNYKNIFKADPASIFVNQSGTTFDYKYDYHLKTNSPGKNAGDDGTDVGIYGTLEPYKTAALPSNPHISFKDIPSSTLPNGTLPIRIKVNAQDR